MTVATNDGGNLPSLPDDLETGLEDFDSSDIVVPRLNIIGKKCILQDSLSNQEFDSVEVILLGLVKQRILWHEKFDEDDAAPMCKSPDHKAGFPVSDDNDKQPKNKFFPWASSGFRKEDFPPNQNGFVQLPCEGCKLKEWGSHPDGKKPYCGELYTLPLLYDPSGNGTLVPAILSIKTSSIKNLKTYLSGFQRTGQAAYSRWTKITLLAAQRGQTDYAIAQFAMGDSTEQSGWREYSNSYTTLRQYLTAHPTPRDDDEDGGAPTSQPEVKPEPGAQSVAEETPPPAAKQPVTQPAATVAATPPDPSPSDSEEDDELPF